MRWLALSSEDSFAAVAAYRSVTLTDYSLLHSSHYTFDT
jgi:hypothetical protein